MTQLFGTDGVRGRANIYPMDTLTAQAIGRAVAHYFKTATSNPRIVIGQDTRVSGDMLACAVAAGICSAGAGVEMLGVLPTPGIAYLASITDSVAGVVISASHNPYWDNGIKVFNGLGFKLDNAAQAAIEQQLALTVESDQSNPDEIGRVKIFSGACESYNSFLEKSVPHLNLNGLTIALDCANGATYQCAPQLFRRLGARVIELFCSPNGININEGCGSQHPQTLARTVVQKKADIGLAFDGDGDRLIAVDESGYILSGDQIMAICAKDMLEKDLLKNRTVVSTVMSNIGFHQALAKMGIRLHTTQVGDRHVMEKMIAEDVVLGGEDSGHMIFRDTHTTGDGILAALRLIDACRTADVPLSHLSAVMTVFPQTMINVDVKKKSDLADFPKITTAIQAAEKQLGDQGRVLVRYSGTQNQCRVMVEGPTDSIVQSLCRTIADVVQAEIG